MLNIAKKSSILMDFGEIRCWSEFATVPDSSRPKSTKIRKMKNMSCELSETPNIIRIDSIALENDKNKNGNPEIQKMLKI